MSEHQSPQPSVGDVCKFWTDDESDYAVGVIDHVFSLNSLELKYSMKGGLFYKYAVPIDPEEALRLLYG